jgi:hypothetical protein
MVLGLCTTAGAGLAITDADIVGRHYVYDLTYAEMASSATFDNDVWQQSNVFVYQEPWPAYARFVEPTRGGSSASFVYRFDFSGTDYRPTHLDLREYVLMVRTEDLNENSRVVTAWSTDNATYTTIQTCTTPVAPSSQWAAYPADISEDVSGFPDAVYYRVTMQNFDGNGFSLVQTQWNRQVSTSPPPDFFRVDFTVAVPPVPEPMGLGCLALPLLARRRRRSV